MCVRLRCRTYGGGVLLFNGTGLGSIASVLSGNVWYGAITGTFGV